MELGKKMEPTDEQLLVEEVKELIEQDPDDVRMQKLDRLMKAMLQENVDRFYTATVKTNFDATTFKLPFRNPDKTPKSYAEVWRIIHDHLPDNRAVQAIIYVNHFFTGKRVVMDADNYLETVAPLGVLIRQVPTPTPTDCYLCATCLMPAKMADRLLCLPFCSEKCRNRHYER